MKEETKETVKKIALGTTVVSAIVAIICGATTTDLNNGIVLADGAVIIISGIISYIFGKKK